jgi:phosphomannomutase
VSIVVDITEISAMVAAAGVMVGVVYYILEMRHQSKVRQTDLVMRLYSIYGSPEFQEAWARTSYLEFEKLKNLEDFEKKFPAVEERIAVGRDLQSQAIFFEGIGVLLHKKLIDIELVDDLLSTSILYFWNKAEPIVKIMREINKRPQVFEWFEYLYNEMKKREQQLQQEGAKNG